MDKEEEAFSFDAAEANFYPPKRGFLLIHNL